MIAAGSSSCHATSVTSKLLCESIEIIIGGGGPNRTIKSWPSACGTIWTHLNARLVADWPPAPTHSLTHSVHCDIQLWKQTARSIQTLPLTRCFEFRSQNSWLTACFLLPYTPSCSVFLSHFLHPDYSPAVSSLSAAHSKKYSPLKLLVNRHFSWLRRVNTGT